jgi:hypothetical protein
MTLHLLHSEFPYTVYEENFILFFIIERTNALLLSFLVQYSGRAPEI